MSYSKIINPKTGRKVSVNGRLGKEILKQYINVLVGGVSPERRAELKEKFAQDADAAAETRARGNEAASEVLNNFEAEREAMELLKQLNANKQSHIISGPIGEVQHACTVKVAADGGFTDDPPGCAGLDKLDTPEPKQKPNSFRVWWNTQIEKRKRKREKKKKEKERKKSSHTPSPVHKNWCDENAEDLFADPGAKDYDRYIKDCDDWRNVNGIDPIYHVGMDDDE